jgi:hypothetical protein
MNTLDGWADPATPVEVIVHDDTTHHRPYRESQELRAWLEKRREEILARDAGLYGKGGE